MATPRLVWLVPRPAFQREAGPQRLHPAFAIHQHAVEIPRRVEQLRHFDVGVTELHGARQRQFQRIQRAHRGGARLQLAVTVHAHHRDSHAILQRGGIQAGALHRCGADQLRVVGDHGEVVQRMHVDHLAGNLQRSTEGQPHVTQRKRHGVAVGNHQAALGIHDQSGAVVVAVADAGQRERHVEGQLHQRWRQRGGGLVAHHRQLRGATGGGARCRSRRQFLAGPDAAGIVAPAAGGREPAAIHAHGAHHRVGGLIQRHEAHRGAIAITQRAQLHREHLAVRHGLVVELGDQRAARHAGGGQRIAGIGHVHAGHRQVEETRLLVGQVVHHRLAELQEAGWGDGIQVADRQQHFAPRRHAAVPAGCACRWRHPAGLPAARKW